MTDDRVIHINNKEKLISKNRHGSYLLYLDEDDIRWLEIIINNNWLRDSKKRA